MHTQWTEVRRPQNDTGCLSLRFEEVESSYGKWCPMRKISITPTLSRAKIPFALVNDLQLGFHLEEAQIWNDKFLVSSSSIRNSVVGVRGFADNLQDD